MFLLKTLCSLWDFGKCLLINQSNIFAIFLDTALLNGGLNQILFRDLFFGFCRWFLVYLKSTLNPLFFRASSYSHFAVLNISSLDEFFDSLSWMEFGIFNRDTVKVSYSCMQNMSKIYKEHNSKVTSTPCNQLTLCNCWVKGECAMDGKYQTMDAVYECRVTWSEPQKIYYELPEGNLHSKNHKRYSYETTLSSYVWHMKETSDVTLNLKWSVVRCATPYSNISKKCLLCLYEKLVIITYPRQQGLLNKQSELLCKCRHENKYLLKNFRVNDKG